MLGKVQGRNGTREFALRSMKNLAFIIAAAEADEDVHPVTQTVGSLLGIVIFPWERHSFPWERHWFNAVKKLRLVTAVNEGWPSWEMSGSSVESNSVKTIGHLVKLLRDSVAHGNVTFDSDSKRLSKVNVTFEDFPPESGKMTWRGVIRADRLAMFCRKFSESVSGSTPHLRPEQ
jgi:hypothetical protein